MKTSRPLIALAAGGSLLGLAVFSASAQTTQPGSSSSSSSSPSTSSQRSTSQQPADAEHTESLTQSQRSDREDRGWMEQIRDWWSSDQGTTETITGTVVDLETYLINGEEAARQQSTSSAALDANDPVALLTEDGDLYILLDRYEFRSMSEGNIGARGSAIGSQIGSQAGTQSSSTRSQSGMQSDSQSQSQSQSGMQSGSQSSQQSATGAQAGRDADSQQFQTHKLTAGREITLSGNVYDRNGVKGLLVQSYQVSDDASGVNYNFDRSQQQGQSGSSFDRTQQQQGQSGSSSSFDRSQQQQGQSGSSSYDRSRSSQPRSDSSTSPSSQTWPEDRLGESATDPTDPQSSGTTGTQSGSNSQSR